MSSLGRQSRGRNANLWLGIAGLGIGWLVGLSVSPVVAIVITSVAGSAAAIIAALSAVDDGPDGRDSPLAIRRLGASVNPLPLAVFVIGLVAGSALGVWFRNNHLLGSDASSELTKWTNAGIARDEVLNRLFDASYPYSAQSKTYSETLTAELQIWTDLGMPREQVLPLLFASRHGNTGTTAGLKLTDPIGLAASGQPLVGSFLFAISAEACDTLRAAAILSEEMPDSNALEEALRSSTTREVRLLPDIISDPLILRQVVEQVLCPKP